MGTDEKAGHPELEHRVRALVGAGDVNGAANVALRGLGPELLGFLSGVLASDADADEVFAAASVRFWRSLATFEWRCSLRTWAYAITRNELKRFRQGAHRREVGRVGISELAETIAVVQTETRATLRSEKRHRLVLLRDELSPEDRELLVLRVDRGLSWDDVALAFLDDPEHAADEERKREAARLRKRFQLVKQRLTARARETGLLSE